MGTFFAKSLGLFLIALTTIQVGAQTLTLTRLMTTTSKSKFEMDLKSQDKGPCFSEQNLKSLEDFSDVLVMTQAHQIKVRVGAAVSEKCRNDLIEVFRRKKMSYSLENHGLGRKIVISSPYLPKTVGSAKSAEPPTSGAVVNELPPVETQAVAADAKSLNEPGTPPEAVNVDQKPAEVTEDKNNSADLEKPKENRDSVQSSDGSAAAVSAGESAEAELPAVPWDIAYRLSISKYTGTGLSSSATQLVPVALNLVTPLGSQHELELDFLLPVAFQSNSPKPFVGHGLIFQNDQKYKYGIGGVFIRQFASGNSTSSKNGSELLDQMAAPEGRVRFETKIKIFKVRGELGLIPTFNGEFKFSISTIYDVRMIWEQSPSDKYFMGYRSETYNISGTQVSQAANLAFDCFFLGYGTTF